MRSLLFLLLLSLFLANALKSYFGDETAPLPIGKFPLDIPQEAVAREKKLPKGEKLFIVEAKKWLDKKSVGEMMRMSGKQSNVIFYNWKEIKEFAASAPGMDRLHHVVNSYLVGYIPFAAKNIWIPWQTIASRKEYQYDHLQNRGQNEIWQNSREAYKYRQGDCEDHSIALADWLIEMGYDARVVLGKYKGSGHAWVVVLEKGKKGRTFLLEATRKNNLSGKHFPLAKLQLDYKPLYMFNRRHFWKNTGTFYTVNYKSSYWKKKSIYSPI